MRGIDQLLHLVKPSILDALLRRIVDQELQKRGLNIAGVTKDSIPATYVSGPPPIQRAWETASTVGSKLHKVVALISNRNGKLNASDSVLLGTDRDNNRMVVGKVVDVADIKVDADWWMGIRPVAPGNTIVPGMTAATEQSTTSTSYVKKKEFKLDRPGRYRFAFELSRSSGVANAIVRIQYNTDPITYQDASLAVTENTVTHPTYASKLVDMSVSVPLGGGVVSIWIKGTGGGTAYIQNSEVRYQDESAALVLDDRVLLN